MPLQNADGEVDPQPLGRRRLLGYSVMSRDFPAFSRAWRKAESDVDRLSLSKYIYLCLRESRSTSLGRYVRVLPTGTGRMKQAVEAYAAFHALGGNIAVLSTLELPLPAAKARKTAKRWIPLDEIVSPRDAAAIILRLGLAAYRVKAPVDDLVGVNDPSVRGKIASSTGLKLDAKAIVQIASASPWVSWGIVDPKKVAQELDKRNIIHDVRRKDDGSVESVQTQYGVDPVDAAAIFASGSDQKAPRPYADPVISDLDDLFDEEADQPASYPSSSVREAG